MVDLFSLLDEPLSYDQGKRKFLFWKLVFVAVNCSGIGDSLKKLFNFHAVEQCDNGVSNFLHIKFSVKSRLLKLVLLWL